MSANLYIVPHDFTKVGDAALKNALFLAKRKQTAIQLLHIVEDKKKTATAKAKLEAIADAIDLSNTDTEISTKVMVGSIFDDIGAMAEADDARLIVMGTHGAKGMQKVFGSYAMKVVTSCGVPFMVVQDDTVVKPIQKIVVPIDLAKESLQVINYAADLALMFDAEVHIVGEKQSDPRLAQQIKIRIALVKKEYEEKNVKNEIHLLDGGKSFHTKVLNYGKEISADMFALAYHSESLLPQFDRFAQTLITNELTLPCLIINSEEVSNAYY